MVASSRLVLAMITWSGLSVALAAGASLGIVTADGSFRLDNATVSGNATLREGAEIETGTTPSNLHLNSGAELRLGAHSKARVYSNRLVLDSGYGELNSAGGYALESASYRIEPGTAGASGKIYRDGEKTVQVASTKGTLRVFDARGLQIANVVAGGDILAFTMQVGGAAPPSSFLGCLMKQRDVFVVFDQATRLTVEVRGDNAQFQQEWGNRVQVIGTTETNVQSDIAAQVVNVSTLSRIGVGGCEPVAQAIGAQLPPTTTAGRPVPVPPPTGGGMSAGTKIAILAGVAGGGGGAAALLLRNNRSN